MSASNAYPGRPVLELAVDRQLHGIAFTDDLILVPSAGLFLNPVFKVISFVNVKGIPIIIKWMIKSFRRRTN